jgi:YesN/AraC family two-component response regulator
LFISGTLGAADSLGLGVERIAYLVKPFTKQELTAALRKVALEPPGVG